MSSHLLRILLAGAIATLPPYNARATTICRIAEFQDHVELLCDGDEKSVSAPSASKKETTVKQEPTTPPAGAEKSAKPAAPPPPAKKKGEGLPVFKSYLQRDLQSAKDFANKKAYRQRVMEEEQRRQPSPKAPQTSMPAEVTE